ncbi:MAG: glycosyltransferase [Acidobacteria bacterium]|nr:glycosyltransferase [Acidobacteriota bacterium]
MNFAHVSTFPPLRCGIASFATDTIAATPGIHSKYSLHYGHGAAADAAASANVRSPDELARLGSLISASDCDVVCLQHEFGIWGGRDGEHIHAFLSQLSKPVVAVLHTTFGPNVRNPVQEEILLRLAAKSERVVVLTPMAKASVEALLGEPTDKLVVIPHGVPDVPFHPPPESWNSGDADRPCRLVTPGFFRESKGFETVLLALYWLIKRGRRLHYTIAGEPQKQFDGQESYREHLQELVQILGLADVVRFDTWYLTLEDQIATIQASHAGVFAYQDPSQSSSGTVPLVLAGGRPAICTPFEYAKDRRGEGLPIQLAEDFGVLALARSIEALLDSPSYPDVTRDTYSRTRAWTWSAVGRRFREVCEDATTSRRTK